MRTYRVWIILNDETECDDIKASNVEVDNHNNLLFYDELFRLIDMYNAHSWIRFKLMNP